MDNGAISDSAVPVVHSISTLLSSFSVVLSALIIAKHLLALEQNQVENRQSCARCNGTGLEPCLCTRWSDRDFGCPSCNHTGLMKCKACGGGGKAVPLAVFLDKDDGGSSSQRY
eukprot:g1682.t1